jgi:hypothetical protein
MKLVKIAKKIYINNESVLTVYEHKDKVYVVTTERTHDIYASFSEEYVSDYSLEETVKLLQGE